VTPLGAGLHGHGPGGGRSLEAAILDRRLKHGSHPVLTWNCWNSVVEIDPTGARKLDKAKSSERIDGMVALTMAVDLASRSPNPEVFEPRLDRELRMRRVEGELLRVVRGDPPAHHSGPAEQQLEHRLILAPFSPCRKCNMRSRLFWSSMICIPSSNLSVTCEAAPC
jgi:Phage Terminase